MKTEIEKEIEVIEKDLPILKHLISIIDSDKNKFKKDYLNDFANLSTIISNWGIIDDEFKVKVIELVLTIYLLTTDKKIKQVIESMKICRYYINPNKELFKLINDTKKELNNLSAINEKNKKEIKKLINNLTEEQDKNFKELFDILNDELIYKVFSN